MKYHISLLIAVLLTFFGCTEKPREVSNPTEPSEAETPKKSLDPNSMIVKAYDKIQIGMKREEVRKITEIDGSPKENNPPHEQVFHYDYDNSYIQIIYSVDFESNSFSVLKKQHIIDNLTTKQRNEKRREAFARWVQQRKDIMNKKRETEKKSPNKIDAPNG